MARRRGNSREVQQPIDAAPSTQHAARLKPPARLFIRLGVLILLLAAVAAVFVWYRPAPNSERILAEVRLCLEHGETARAQALLDKLLRRQSDNGMALLYRGQLALERGELETALRDFRRVPERPTKTAGTARYLEASALLQLGAARQAEQKLLESIELHPRYPQPHERHLQLCVLQLRRDATLQRLAALEQLRPLGIEELSLRVVAGTLLLPIEQAEPTLRSFVAQDPDDVVSFLALARYLADDQRAPAAVQMLEQLLARHAADERVRGLLVELLVDQGRVDVAAAAASRLNLGQTAPLEAWRGAARLAEQQGEFEKAAQSYAQVVRLNPDDYGAQYHLGQLLQRIGRGDEGKVHLERSVLVDRLQHHVLSATRIDPQNARVLLPTLLEIGQLLNQLQRFELAIGWLQVALAIDPDHAEARAELMVASNGLRPGTARDLAGPPAASHGRPATVTATPQADGPKAAAVAGGTVPQQGSVISLVDVHEQLRIRHQYFNGQTGNKYLIESMGGGVAVLDYDADGWPDLYFPQGSHLPVDLADRRYSDRLLRNRADGTFEDVTEKAGIAEHGYSQGCAAGDLNNDGYTDLVVANYGRNTVYENNGDGTFRDVTALCGAEAPEMSSSVGLADLDRDGDLDMYVANYVDSLKICRSPTGQIRTCHPSNFDSVQDRLYENRGDGTFLDVTATSGIVAADGKGLGIVIADLDDNGWPDIYVANDATPNFFFRSDMANAGPGPATMRFQETGLISGLAVSGEGRAEAGMGIACGDLNGDGRLDLLTTNYFLETVTLYENQGDAFFMDRTRAAGLYGPTERVLGFGTQALDLDLDGDLELFMANGHIDNYEDEGAPWKMPAQLFRNQGTGRFAEISQSSGAYFAGQQLGRGAARWDWNRDGRPDLVVVHQDAQAAVLSNTTKDAGRGVVLELHGVESNREAIGARIRVVTGKKAQIIEICGGDGFYATNERRQFVGLGDAAKLDELEVRWPSGRIETWNDLPVNVQLVVVEGGEVRAEALEGAE